MIGAPGLRLAESCFFVNMPITSPSLSLSLSNTDASHLRILPCVFTQLSVTDVSARTSMKGAAKCDKHCELQNSVNQLDFERTHHFRDMLESMPASVSTSLT